MSCWAVDSFGNDDAADWVAALVDQTDSGLVDEAIADVLNTSGYLEAPSASQALAAIEVLAAILHRPSLALLQNEQLVEWVRDQGQTVSPQQRTSAIAAIDRIIGDESELRELWEESEEFGDWKKIIADLRLRLTVDR